jgi:hypothetical protein
MSTRSLAVAALFGITLSATLCVVVGCASSSSDKPYSVTGTNLTDDEERKEQLRWTDDKGHYRPDLRMQGGVPLRTVQ